jgi:hypothetical protein
MIILFIALLPNHHMAICYGGFALVYASLAILQRRHPSHAIAYGGAAILASTVAVCEAVVH